MFSAPKNRKRHELKCPALQESNSLPVPPVPVPPFPVPSVPASPGPDPGPPVPASPTIAPEVPTSSVTLTALKPHLRGLLPDGPYAHHMLCKELNMCSDVYPLLSDFRGSGTRYSYVRDICQHVKRTGVALVSLLEEALAHNINEESYTVTLMAD